ncbi:MAG TPA: M48 family metalloprotease [Bryobacteraceae bacterium]|nr:M48 family metalloprotease [Bryobacteraceae bacterium]
MPSYVWLEASGSREHVGWLCIGAGCGGGLVWLVCAGRLLQNLARSRRYMARWTHEGRRAQLCENSTPAWVIGSDVPFLALAGIVQPRLIASRGLVRVLSPGQLNAAVGHEAAHQASHDNLKRLILRSIPRIVPFGGGMERIEHAWMKFAERAADDWAVAGQAARALLLAEALVRVARIGGAYASPLTAPLLADARELHARVDRLVNPAPIPPVAGPSGRRTIWLGVGLFAAIAVGPAVLRAVHELLESLIR